MLLDLDGLVQIDSLTLMLVQGLSVFFFGIGILIISFIPSWPRIFLRLWAIGMLAGSLGLLMRAIDPLMDDQQGNFLANSFYLAGFYFLFYGTARLRFLEISTRLNNAGLVLGLLLLIFFTQVIDSYFVRVLILSGYGGYYMLRTTYVMIRYKADRLVIAEWILAFSFGSAGAGMMVRFAVTLFTSPEFDSFHTNFDANYLYAIAFYSVFNIMMIAMALVLANDVSKRQNEIIAERTRALEEKELLLREVNHRVKNNLSIVQSLLNLQATQVSDESSRLALEDSGNRVKAISRLHHRLSKSENLRSVSVPSLFREITDDIVNSMKRFGEISLILDVDEQSLDANTLVPLTLIVSELVTNACKYAFPNEKPGTIELHFKEDDGDLYSLEVKDNGIGFSQDQDVLNSESLGLKIVHSLVDQLQGELTVSSSPGNGSSFKLVFRDFDPDENKKG